MYNTILIDLDNTILDFDADENKGFIKTIEHLGMEYRDTYLREYKKINGQLWNALEKGEITKDIVLNTRFTKFFKLYDLDVDGEEIENIYRSYLNNSSNKVPHAEHTLRKLKEMNKKIYSASNGVYTTQISRLTNAGLLDLFDGHFISEKLGYEKPAPEFFKYVLDSLSPIDTSKIIMVGDNPLADIEGGHRAGLATCLYRNNSYKTSDLATYIIDDISKLLDIV